MLAGEAGVGKTRLLREVRDWCGQRGATALVGRAVDTATAVPFRPPAEALLGAYRSGPIADVVPFRGALAQLVPDGPPGPAAPLLHVAEGFLRVARTRGRAGPGCAVLLDDLHWADAETMAVIEYLADNLHDEPVLLVAAARSDDGGVVAGLSSLVDRRVAALLELSRLGPDDTAAMARACLGDAAVPAQVLHTVAERADGLPFFVEELLGGLRADGALVRDGDRWVVHDTRSGRPPATFHESVRHRMRSLTPAHRELLRDAALLGRHIDPALLVAVSNAAPTTVDAALAAALELTLVQTYELGLRFRHALTRDALLADLLAPERVERSRRALAALRAVRPELPGSLVEVAADLADYADERAPAVALLLESARRAAGRGALTTAESAQRRALALTGDGRDQRAVMAALITTLGMAGRVEEAVALGTGLLARLAADGTADPGGSQRLMVHLALARAAAAATAWVSAADHLTQARKSVRATETGSIAGLGHHGSSVTGSPAGGAGRPRGGPPSSTTTSPRGESR